MDNGQLIPHLFRTEYRKIVSVLCRHFGFAHIETAEDLASDTFLTAAQTWGIKGIPQNPVAWLYNVAKNKARNHVQRDALFDKKIAPDLKTGGEGSQELDIDLSPENINDSQLQMMFAICHPSIPVESQIGLSLRILCGFGIEEIADAFLTNKETINKRLFRAREKLREANIPIALPAPAAIDTRLTTVLKTIYLLFNEGYYSLGPTNTLRKELCYEAMRLCTMLVEHPPTNRPAVNALLSLMCFHASRFDARLNAAGELILYDEQDTNLWNTDLISKGGYFLHCAASGPTLSQYHLEAGIAYWNTRKDDSKEKWESILQLYNQLLQIEYSPIAALNRTYALSKANGREAAIVEAEKLQLTNHHFYYLLLGELYTGIDQAKSLQYFQQALLLARTDAERQAIQKKLRSL
ncbi:sigma-70 family RNA polymerase sigma factor [Paraflavitalea soli]|uniref:Sigma-70 family RNA polymerase sigma factor n=1 Tax=Paraflavitalea soli TaxID=2315862 RepID=A0A3B7MIZ4_9BACT|nr:sigma-70 family RNA polymerase sigma factor [Paraflavitalea soli]AXY73557.1 sigma-70 family RNA polymerase sigma factor [Paraflavitalea soli]